MIGPSTVSSLAPSLYLARRKSVSFHCCNYRGLQKKSKWLAGKRAADSRPWKVKKSSYYLSPRECPTIERKHPLGSYPLLSIAHLLVFLQKPYESPKKQSLGNSGYAFTGLSSLGKGRLALSPLDTRGMVKRVNKLTKASTNFSENEKTWHFISHACRIVIVRRKKGEQTHILVFLPPYESILQLINHFKTAHSKAGETGILPKRGRHLFTCNLLSSSVIGFLAMNSCVTRWT